MRGSARTRALLVGCLDCQQLSPLISGAGELLVLRNPGNVVPRFGGGTGSEAASIEHAVDGLGVRDLVVVGHTGCGVMRLIVAAPATRRPTAMDAFLRHADGVRRTVAARAGRAAGDELIDAAARCNVVVQLENARTHPAVLLRERTADPVRLHGWMVDTRTGRLSAYAPERDRFVAAGRSGWPG